MCASVSTDPLRCSCPWKVLRVDEFYVHTVATKAPAHGRTAQDRLCPASTSQYSLSSRAFSTKYNSQNSAQPSGIVLSQYVAQSSSASTSQTLTTPGPSLCFQPTLDELQFLPCRKHYVENTIVLFVELSQEKARACSLQTQPYRPDYIFFLWLIESMMQTQTHKSSCIPFSLWRIIVTHRKKKKNSVLKRKHWEFLYRLETNNGVYFSLIKSRMLNESTVPSAYFPGHSNLWKTCRDFQVQRNHPKTLRTVCYGRWALYGNRTWLNHKEIVDFWYLTWSLTVLLPDSLGEALVIDDSLDIPMHYSTWFFLRGGDLKYWETLAPIWSNKAFKSVLFFSMDTIYMLYLVSVGIT